MIPGTSKRIVGLVTVIIHSRVHSEYSMVQLYIHDEDAHDRISNDAPGSLSELKPRNLEFFGLQHVYN